MGIEKGKPLSYIENSQKSGVSLVRFVDGKEVKIPIEINFAEAIKSVPKRRDNPV